MGDPRGETATPRRDVHCADAVVWLRAHRGLARTAVVTSLPDVSEALDEAGGVMPLDQWQRWFVDVVAACVDAIDDDGFALFFQTDIKRDGRWVDKGFLVVDGARGAGAQPLFHKIVCRRPPGTTTFGRPSYTHLIGVSRRGRVPDVLGVPDVITDAGPQTWSRAMGRNACTAAVRIAVEHGGARTILDPFCGVGTVLAVANQLGVDAIGVDRSSRRVERARRIAFPAPAVRVV